MASEKKIKVYITNASMDAMDSELRRYISATRMLSSHSNCKYDAVGFSTEILLAYALKMEGCSYSPPMYSKTPLGKPVSDECFFSLSHSGEYCCCCISNSDVGVDIQVDRKMIEGIERRILNETELIELDSCSDRTSFLLSRWTAKESCLKLMGKGIPYGMNRLCVDYNSSAITDVNTNEKYFISIIELDKSSCDLFVNDRKLFLSVCTKDLELIGKIDACHEIFSSIKHSLMGYGSD